MNEHEALVDRTAQTKRTVVLLGGIDSGKTTLARSMLRASVASGRPSALVDADVGQKTVGPPATVTVKLARNPGDLEAESLADADELSFVGSTSPEGQLLSIVTSVARLADRARERGADFVVVDTSGFVSGVYGQILNYHMIEMLRPDLVVGLQRGEELQPLLGVVQRFFGTDVVPLPIVPGVIATTVERRADNREASMRRYFSGELHRWRVKPTVFMPALPPLFDLAQLDRLLVGLSDGNGGYLGIGYLEFAADEGLLRLISPVAEGPKALRLGSVRLEDGYRAKRVDLRNLFGSD